MPATRMESSAADRFVLVAVSPDFGSIRDVPPALRSCLAGSSVESESPWEI
jgi:hypothetical protein